MSNEKAIQILQNELDGFDKNNPMMREGTPDGDYYYALSIAIDSLKEKINKE